MAGFTYTPFQYKEFEESDATKALKDKATAAEDAVANYGQYQWADQEKYNQLLQNYENRPDFTYDFNADALYQQYKDKYIQQGKMAMADTMGQAAAMTGGYGNSYAATAGNQAYQASLQNLNDIVPQLYQMAYDQYNQKGQDMLNMIGLMSNERAFDYGTWTDAYNMLVSDRDYYGNKYNNERTFDYGVYDADRNLAHGEHTNTQGYAYNNYRDAIADEQWQKTYDLSERELKMAEEAWELQKKASSTSGSSSGSSSGGSGSGSGGSTVTGNGGSTDIPASIQKKAESFESNTALASYLDGLEKSGTISPTEADKLYAQFADDNEKYITDKDGKQTTTASYKDMVGSTNGWEVIDNGGGNLLGIDANAIVKAPNGQKMTLAQLKQTLIKEGMKAGKAADAIKALQQALGISSRKIFNW